MKTEKKLKIGIVGLGNIGRLHLKNISDIENAEIAGLCDVSTESAVKLASEYGTKAYSSYKELLDNSDLDAVIIAVPHTFHEEIAVAAFKKGIHVMCEKPVTVHYNQAKRINEAYMAAKKKYPDILFGIMFQERTLPLYRKIREIVTSGELGKLIRVTWINTDWFRTQAYYDSSSWRATWKGEGGGILTNQCPHNLDFYQWTFGVPEKITGKANLGKYHNIEVEDEVFAYFEHANGMLGHFIVSTAETNGTNRLEIVGDYGKLIYDNGKLICEKYKESSLLFIQTSEDGFRNMDHDIEEIKVDELSFSPHKHVMEAFINKALHNEGELVADGLDGINSVMIANAVILSSFKEKTVDVPFDGNEYELLLHDLINNSRFKKKEISEPKIVDLSSSFERWK